MIKKNLFSIGLGMLILYLSLARGDSFNDVGLLKIPHSDKIAHFIMYFALMSVIIFENRKFKITKDLLLLAIIPFSYGVIIEILQLLITTTRTGSLYDVVFNLAGIICSLLLWWNNKTLRNLIIK